MRQRLPLLRTLLTLVTAFVLSTIAVLGFWRIDRVVVAPGRIEEIPKQAVKEGDEMLRLQVGSPARFEGALPDAGRTLVRPGQRAKIRLEAYPWLTHGALQGRVVRVADRSADAGGFPVEIEIEAASAPGALREGMGGTARIVVEEKVSLARLFLEPLTGREGQ